MVLFNYSTKELTAKVVYYGPGLCGKTTNLQWIHEKLPIKNKGKMLSLATETDRTLFFDFLPIELGMIRGMKTRIQLYTVPGQVFYNATRRMVLKGADCVVFVADSQDAMLEANAESLENLRENLEVNDISLDDIPLVMQYNKRDLPNALPIEQLNARLNTRGVPYYEAVAVKGVGVEETLKGVTSLVFKSLATRYGGPEGKAAASKTSVPAPNVVKAAAAPAPIPPAPVPPPPLSAPPPAPPPPPARATGAFSPSDLLDADPIEVGPDEMELDLEPADDAGDALEELTLDDLGAEPEPPAQEEPLDLDLELELQEPPPLETVEEFSPLSELEGFALPAGGTTSPFGATTQPGPAAADPLAELEGDAGFEPSSLGVQEPSTDPSALLEPEPPPVAAPMQEPEPPPVDPPMPEPEPLGFDPASLSGPGAWDASAPPAAEPEPAGFDPGQLSLTDEPGPLPVDEPEIDLPGLGEPEPVASNDTPELEDLFSSAPEPPPSLEPEPEPPLPEPEPAAEDPMLELSMDGPDADPLSELGFEAAPPEAEEAAGAGPLTAPIPRYTDEEPEPQPTAPFPVVQEDPLSGLGGDPLEAPALEAPPLPESAEPVAAPFEPEWESEPVAPEPPPLEPAWEPQPEPVPPQPPPFEPPPFEPQLSEPQLSEPQLSEPQLPEPPLPEPPLPEPPLPEPQPLEPPPFEPPPFEPPPPEPPPFEPAPSEPEPPPAARQPEPAMAVAAGAPARHAPASGHGAVATATVERAITPTVGSVALAGGGAENDITIPVEVTLGPGGATQVNLNIRLTLNFKLQ